MKITAIPIDKMTNFCYIIALNNNMTMFKKLLILPLMGMFILPAQSAQALMLLDSPTESLIKNIDNAQAINFSLELDLKTMNEQMEAPLNMHADVDGIWNENDNDSYDFNFWMSHDGEFKQSDASVILTSENIYVSDGDSQWYFIDQFSPADFTDSNDQEVISQLEDSLQDLFSAGVIKYDAETVDYINNMLTVRYAYEVDGEKLISYLQTENQASEEELEEIKAYFDDNLTIGGYLWVDTINMLPVMFTLNINKQVSALNYSSFELSVLFNSFNEPVAVKEPKNAVSIDNYTTGETEKLIMSGIEKTMDNIDADGDGLTDNQENTVWKTDPFKNDTDGDGYGDYTEVINGYNPNGFGKLDSDKDGLTDYSEMTIHWSDPNNADSDGDGYNDGIEIANGYDPNGPGRF